MKINERMLNDLIRDIGPKKLPVPLYDIVNNGFIQKGGCYIFSFFDGKRTHSPIDDFADKTGYECFVNSLVMEDYIMDDYYVTAYYVILHVFIRWKKEKYNCRLRSIFIDNGENHRLIFHVDRSGERYLVENLDSYQGESIFEIVMSD